MSQDARKMFDSILFASNVINLDDVKRLTLASPASDQHVALLALTVVRAHAVDAAAPLTIWRPLTLIDIWREGYRNSVLECDAPVTPEFYSPILSIEFTGDK